ncbi:MAG: Fic family protein [Clostridia bacterium]|nr:Fic family protein [Clostridia bacterium]
MVDDNRLYELEEYIKQGEPDKVQKSRAWKTAIGLQAVDNLKISNYLIDTAKEHIEGKITIADAQKRVSSYYKQRDKRKEKESETEEGDIVSTRITAILGEKAFNFSPAEFKEIHRRLFTGVFDHAGKYRDYNITKNEWVLGGDTVTYAAYQSIIPTLEYDFKAEKEFSYDNLSAADSVKHISQFASGIWQIHPFGEGNTRTTAVFVIKYLKTFGFEISNDEFEKNSWYFRNALARANYNNVAKGITATTEFLDRFFENLLLGGNNELKNRYVHIDYAKTAEAQSATSKKSKCKNCTLEEAAIMDIIKEYPDITQKELAAKIGKSERTIKTRTVAMQEKGLIERAGGKRNGKWLIIK